MNEQDFELVLGDNHRLRIENDQLRKERDVAIRQREEAQRHYRLAFGIDYIVKLREERDEARRWYLAVEPWTDAVGRVLGDERAEAAHRGWDCYKEETP